MTDTDTQAVLIEILEQLDTKRFRAVTNAPDAITDDDLIENMHKLRSQIPEVSRVKRMDSKRWLYGRLH